MAGPIRVNTDQVGQIATNIEKLNKELLQDLQESESVIKDLLSSWEGEAAQETYSSFAKFAQQFFDSYYDTIDQYVKFLRVHVDEGYFETETANITLADAFK